MDTMPNTLILFGASGDLCRRKLIPALMELHNRRLLPDTFHIYGYSRKPMTDDGFRAMLRDALVTLYPDADVADWDAFAARLHYITGQYDSVDDLNGLHAVLRAAHPDVDSAGVVYYFALPPEATEQVLATLPKVTTPAWAGRARVLLEKPFGEDLPSARAMNRVVAGVFPEERVRRIDHYLAKSAVRNLLVFRFSNVFFEPIWNNRYIDNIQILAAETLGVDGRAGYYDHAGVVRDMLQNHVLAMLALATMEPPSRGASIGARFTETLGNLLPPRYPDFVFGQYDGYREETGVAEGSRAPTYAAARFEIDSWRWRGVPIYVRSGKKLKRRVSEIVVAFKSLPATIFGKAGADRGAPNRLRIRIQPDEGIDMAINVRAEGPGNLIVPSALDFSFAHLAAKAAPAPCADDPAARAFGLSGYALVLYEALGQGAEIYWRSDDIVAAWEAVTPMLAQFEPFPYAPGGWGPKEADAILARDGRAWL